MAYWFYILSVIRQEGESQNGCFKKIKHAKFSGERPFTPWYAHMHVGKKNSFFGKFGVLCFLKIRVLRFAFLPYYRRFSGVDIESIWAQSCISYRK